MDATGAAKLITKSGQITGLVRREVLIARQIAILLPSISDCRYNGTGYLPEWRCQIVV